MADGSGIRMVGIDEDVPLHPGDDRGDEENGAAPLGEPGMAEAAGDLAARFVPARQAVRVQDLIGRAGRDGDLDAMLVGRQAAAPVDQPLQHRRRVVLGRVDHGVADRVPAALDAPRTLGAVNWIVTLGVADAPGDEPILEPAMGRQRAMPASARRIRASTASAPAVLERAMSRGLWPASSGCGRSRKASVAARSPCQARAAASITRLMA